MRTAQANLRVGAAAELILLTVLADTVGLGPAGWLIGLGCGVAVPGLLARALAHAGRDALAPADWVTLARATLVGGVVALIADSVARPPRVGALVALAAIALALDAVDGRVARRTHTASPLGARFDLEVDAFLILVLSAYDARRLGLWVMGIGAARYGFVAAGWVWPWLRRPTPSRYWCKVVAAIQGITLTTVAADVLPRAVAEALIMVAFAFLAESFGRDVWWLARHRTPVPGRVPRLMTRAPIHG